MHMVNEVESSIVKSLVIKRWATPLDTFEGEQHLAVGLAPRPLQMAHSKATGKGLASNGFLGVDEIRLKGGDKFVPHTHPGDHLLIIVGGQGTITYDGKIYSTQAGDIYMVEGAVPHGVGAITDHVILAVGAPHMPVESPDRMQPVEYKEVLSEVGDMHCLICGVKAGPPDMLHQNDCPHCPCDKC
jgi:mannose-6-phosphate isomerase-like protein (cupin superfamily)